VGHRHCYAGCLWLRSATIRGPNGSAPCTSCATGKNTAAGSEKYLHPGTMNHEIQDPLSAGPEADAIIAEAAATESDPLRTELAEQKDLNLRLAADFENFKRRTRQEAEGRALAREESFIHELLPALDNLERALASGLRARWACLQDARCIGSTRASCNGFTSLSAHQRRRQNALISLD